MSTMKKVAGVVLAVTATAGAAAAANVIHETAGRIEHLNPRRQHLTVGNQIFRYDPRIVGVGLRRGEHVRILYRETHGHRYAIKIMPSSA